MNDSKSNNENIRMDLDKTEFKKDTSAVSFLNRQKSVRKWEFSTDTPSSYSGELFCDFESHIEQKCANKNNRL